MRHKDDHEREDARTHDHVHTDTRAHEHPLVHSPMEIVGDEPPTVERIRDRRERLEAKLRAAAERGGHDPERLRIVAVTKTWPVAVCRAALDAGCRMLGENRVQEAEPKVAALPEADWHLVGRLQSNKARRAVAAFGTIHSVDSLELLRRIDGIAHDLGTTPKLLLQVNLSGEQTRAGFEEATFSRGAEPGGEIASAVEEIGSARVVGLMTMAALGVDEATARATFGRLRALRDALEQSTGIGLGELSMGMTADAEAAAAEGATLVRIGTALFGPRAG